MRPLASALAILLAASFPARGQSFDVPAVGPSGPARAAFLPVAAPAGPAAAPGAARSVGLFRLADVADAHWRGADSFGAGKDLHHVSVHFEAGGDAYLAVLAEGRREPAFYKLEAGMTGGWTHEGARYRLSLDASVFRRRFDNWVEIRKEGSPSPVYRRTLTELFTQVYAAGAPVAAGSGEYRLFYSRGLDTTRRPAVLAPAESGVVLVRGVKDARGEYAFTPYIVPAGKLRGGGLVWSDFGGQRLGLRLAADEIEVFE